MYISSFFSHPFHISRSAAIHLLQLAAPGHQPGLICHPFSQDTVPTVRIIDEHMGDCADDHAVLDDRTAAHSLHDAICFGEKLGSVTRMINPLSSGPLWPVLAEFQSRNFPLAGRRQRSGSSPGPGLIREPTRLAAPVEPYREELPAGRRFRNSCWYRCCRAYLCLLQKSPVFRLDGHGFPASHRESKRLQCDQSSSRRFHPLDHRQCDAPKRRNAPLRDPKM